ncbi:MAG: protein-L-isoaspartate(D-aspartate) O-methyltransferase [Anaerolineaceae bacterium]
MPCQAQDYEKERLEMVSQQIEARGLRDPGVLEAMRCVPRHCFVPENLHAVAYEDRPLPIGQHQTISQPYMVALMSAMMLPDSEASVLEIGTGSGYQAAVLAHLFKQVYTIELREELALQAIKTFAEYGFSNIETRIGDGSGGWQEHAPYHAIVVTAASPRPPRPLLDQLKENGRLIIPVGGWEGQTLQIWTAEKEDYVCTYSISVAFVPLRGQYGWSETDWQWYDK